MLIPACSPNEVPWITAVGKNAGRLVLEGSHGVRAAGDDERERAVWACDQQSVSGFAAGHKRERRESADARSAGRIGESFQPVSTVARVCHALSTCSRSAGDSQIPAAFRNLTGRRYVLA